MCGRFAVGNVVEADWSAWLDTAEAEWPAARWNIAPTTEVAIRRADRRLCRARWGLVPHWWSKPLALMKATTFNARSEEAAEKPFFRDAWAGRGASGRCLIPAIGYYEWSGRKGAKTPWFVTTRRNTPGFCFAGLWAESRIGGETLLSCTILTTAAGAATAHLHPRSPVILEDSAWAHWLAEPSPDLMRPPEDDRLDLWEVSPAVGNVRNEGPELIERVGLPI